MQGRGGTRREEHLSNLGTAHRLGMAHHLGAAHGLWKAYSKTTSSVGTSRTRLQVEDNLHLGELGAQLCLNAPQLQVCCETPHGYHQARGLTAANTSGSRASVSRNCRKRKGTRVRLHGTSSSSLEGNSPLWSTTTPRTAWYGGHCGGCGPQLPYAKTYYKDAIASRSAGGGRKGTLPSWRGVAWGCIDAWKRYR